LEETVPFAKKLEEAGVNLIDVSAGLYETTYIISQPMDVPLGCNVPLAEEIKRAVNIPVTVVGRINDPAFAENILNEGQADFVSFGRALHSDPDFPQKAREGRLDDICMCIACMQGCIDILGTAMPIFVPLIQSGRERELRLRKPLKQEGDGNHVGQRNGSSKGAALRGRRFHYEKEKELGGQLRWASKALFKSDSTRIRYLSNQLKKAGVKVNLGQADKDFVYKIKLMLSW
jgi:hypothetical protein